jgi:hypothetical protein
VSTLVPDPRVDTGWAVKKAAGAAFFAGVTNA